METGNQRLLLRSTRNRLAEALQMLNDAALPNDELIKYMIACALSELGERLGNESICTTS